MNNDNENKKGFSGLSGLASDVSDTIKAEQSKLKSGAGEEKVNKASGSGQASNQTRTVESTKKVEVSTSHENSGHKKYFITVAVIAILLWIVSQSNDRNTTSPKPLPKSSSQPVPDSGPTSVPTQLSYTKPSVGTNNILNVSEIRWCIREGIRIDAMRNVFSSNSGVDKFNSLVNDYNSRCGSYRYRSGAQSRAERDVAPYKTEIQTDAKTEATNFENRVISLRSSESFQADSNSMASSLNNYPSYDAIIVRQVQEVLSDFGYDTGVIDGKFGSKTESAIKSFQRDAELAEDGIPSQELLNVLNYVKAEISKKQSNNNSVGEESSRLPDNAYVSGSRWYCRDGYKRVGDRCDKVIAPENSYVSGSRWYCRDGYKRVGDRCDKVIAPENSYVSGSRWYCRDGYKRVGDKCDKVIAPENSYVSGSRWYCRDGYKRIGDRCDKVIAPENSYVSGSRWYCRDGYKRVRDRCEKVFD